MTDLPPLDHLPAEGWREQAACKGTDPAIWFPERGIGARESAAIKAICEGCPVRVDCLTTALDDAEKFGFFGGASERERRVMRRDWPRRACEFCRKPIPHEPASGVSAPVCETCAAAATAKARMDDARRQARHRLWDARPTIHERTA